MSFFFSRWIFYWLDVSFLEKLGENKLLHGGERGRDGGLVAGNES